MNHYTDFQTPSSALVGFVNILRFSDFKAGLQDSKDSVDVLLDGFCFDHQYLEPALASIFCQSPNDRKKFSDLYKKFWLQKGTRIQDSGTYKNKKNIIKKPRSAAVMIGTGKDDETGELEESKNTSGANAKETLKQTDFSKLSVIQSEELDQIVELLVREMKMRIKRRRKKSKQGKLNIQNSIRKNIQNGGNIIELMKERKTKEKFSLLVLLDVSGSMDKYSYYLLKFLWALRSQFKDVEVFAFSTILKRITEQLHDRNIQMALAQVSMVSNHWSSGTKIGSCLQKFNDDFARYYLNGKTMTIIMSDGLDTGDLDVLDEAILKIKRKSKRLIWLNPLKGMKGYEPIQRGIQTVLPNVNHFGSAHNLASLLALEDILINA